MKNTFLVVVHPNPDPIELEDQVDQLLKRASKIEGLSSSKLEEHSFHELHWDVQKNRSVIALLPPAGDLDAIVARIRVALEQRSESNIRQEIGLLLSSYPNLRKDNDCQVYVESLIRDVFDLGFSDVIVRLAARNIRRTLKFPPTIAEFIEFARKYESQWRCMLGLQRRQRDLVECVQRGEALLADTERWHREAAFREGWRMGGDGASADDAPTEYRELWMRGWEIGSSRRRKHLMASDSDEFG